MTFDIEVMSVVVGKGHRSKGQVEARELVCRLHRWSSLVG